MTLSQFVIFFKHKGKFPSTLFMAHLSKYQGDAKVDQIENSRVYSSEKTIKEVAMLISQAITIFMDYQKMNSGKKYGQKLRAFSQQIQSPFWRL